MTLALKLKLNMWARTHSWIPHPMNPRISMPFLVPTLQGPEGNVQLDALTGNNISLLLGDGGSGKSTVSKQLTYFCSEGLPPFIKDQYSPVFLRLKPQIAGVSSTHDLADYCHGEFQDLNISTEDFDKLLNSPKLFLVLDGLDEIFDPTARKSFFNFASSHLADRNVLLTSRPNEVVSPLPHYTIDTIPDETKRRYIERKYNKLHGVKGDEFTERFFKEAAKHPYLQPLLNNPLLLEQASIIFTGQSSFPPDIYGFIENLVEAFAFQFPRVQEDDHFKSALSREQYGLMLLDIGDKMGNYGDPVKKVFYDAASRLFQLGIRSMHFNEYVEIIKECFETKGTGLNDDELKLATRSFLQFCPAFCEYERDHFGFIHLSLQDNIGIIAAVNCGPDVKEGYDSYIRNRDNATKKRYFECLAAKNYPPQEWFNYFVEGGIVDATNVVPFMEVVTKKNITLTENNVRKITALIPH